MAEIKVLALDLDGTLTNSQKEVTPRTRAALDAAIYIKVKKHLLSYCTMKCHHLSTLAETFVEKVVALEQDFTSLSGFLRWRGCSRTGFTKALRRHGFSPQGGALQ